MNSNNDGTFVRLWVHKGWHPRSVPDCQLGFSLVCLMVPSNVYLKTLIPIPGLTWPANFWLPFPPWQTPQSFFKSAKSSSLVPSLTLRLVWPGAPILCYLPSEVVLIHPLGWCPYWSFSSPPMEHPFTLTLAEHTMILLAQGPQAVAMQGSKAGVTSFHLCPPRLSRVKWRRRKLLPAHWVRHRVVNVQIIGTFRQAVTNAATQAILEF
jgi:hypothetical protein